MPHLVCVRPDGTGEGDHFAAYEIDLLAAQDRFEELDGVSHWIPETASALFAPMLLEHLAAHS